MKFIGVLLILTVSAVLMSQADALIRTDKFEENQRCAFVITQIGFFQKKRRQREGQEIVYGKQTRIITIKMYRTANGDTYETEEFGNWGPCK